MTRHRAALLALTLAVGLLPGCRRGDQETGSIQASDVREARANLPEGVRMHLDSGNAAYRRSDYAGARDHYRAAIDIDRSLPAPWFGVYMAERALGDSAAAGQALEQAQRLAPGATLIHPSAMEQGGGSAGTAGGEHP